MLTERIIIGKLEILEDGQIQVRQDTVIERDGVEISRLYHRRVLEPSITVPEESDTRIGAIAAVVWTPEVIATYEEKRKKSMSAPVVSPSGRIRV